MMPHHRQFDTNISIDRTNNTFPLDNVNAVMCRGVSVCHWNMLEKSKLNSRVVDLTGSDDVDADNRGDGDGGAGAGRGEDVDQWLGSDDEDEFGYEYGRKVGVMGDIGGIGGMGHLDDQQQGRVGIGASKRGKHVNKRKKTSALMKEAVNKSDHQAAKSGVGGGVGGGRSWEMFPIKKSKIYQIKYVQNLEIACSRSMHDYTILYIVCAVIICVLVCCIECCISMLLLHMSIYVYPHITILHRDIHH